MKEEAKNITRRDFLRGTAAAAVAASVGDWGRGQDTPPAARSSRVVVVRDAQVLNDRREVDTTILRRMLDQAVTELTGEKEPRSAWQKLFRPGDTVGLVPTDHLNPTHPELVEAVRGSLLDLGVSGGRIIMAQGGPEKPRACTALVSLPALKAHWLTGIGTVFKNYIMFTGHPSRYHQEDNAKLGEIWTHPDVRNKTRLVLVDALYPLCDKGPQPDPRYRWPYRGLIAGADPVAVETVGLKIITEKRKELRGEPWPLSPPPLCVEAADKVYGLGTSKWEEIQLRTLGYAEGLLLS